MVRSVVSFTSVQCLCLVTHRPLVRVLVHIFLPVSLVFQLYNDEAVYGHAQVQDMHMSSASVLFYLSAWRRDCLSIRLYTVLGLGRWCWSSPSLVCLNG